MGRKKLHRKQYYAVERFCYIAMGLFFIADLYMNLIPDSCYGFIFPALVFYYVLQQFLYETSLARFDGAFHFKSQKGRYRPNQAYAPRPIARKGIGTVLILYLVYAAVLAYLRRKGLLTWPLYMGGACLILALNNLFIYYKCPFQEFLLKGVTCCADCHINAWDYFIFATGLLLAPRSAPWIEWAVRAIWLFSLAVLANWEITLRRHPERFTPAGNMAVGCRECGKPCTSANSWLAAARRKGIIRHGCR